MEESDIYYVPKLATQGFYKEKASKFHAYLFPVHNTDDVENSLQEIKNLHPKARHICYAYRLAPKDQAFRMNDDNEPSGTAGKPIFNEIQSANAHQILIAVVRYFGGTKLGASGLIRAYKTAAEEACKEMELLEKYDVISFKISFDYARMGDVMNIVKSMELEILDKEFDLKPYIIVNLRDSLFKSQINQIKASLLYRDIADIKEDTEVENVDFELIDD